MILLIDNYDSFSYNLVQLIGELCEKKYQREIVVYRNDALTVDEIAAMAPEAIILSPGPGRPENAGICEKVIQSLGSRIPIFGVCLGHQAICEVYGAKITYAGQLMHGKQSEAELDAESRLFQGMSHSIQVARYHSLAARPETMPEQLRVTAKTRDGEVMAAEHRDFPVFGVQFHPESVLTPEGKQILENFLNFALGEGERQNTK